MYPRFEYKAIMYPDGRGTVVKVDTQGPFKMARFKAESNKEAAYSLEDSLVKDILLPCRYAVPGLEHTEFEFTGSKQGRTIDIIKDEPYRLDDVPDTYFHILSFKGTGAVPQKGKKTNEYIIHPIEWFLNIKSYGRIWGSMNEPQALGEGGDLSLKKAGVPHTPYVSINVLSRDVEGEIYRQVNEQRQDLSKLCQVVRLSQTNIRCDESIYHRDSFRKACNEAGWTPDYFVDMLVKADAATCIAEKNLFLQGKRLEIIDAGVMDNRLWTGEMTDLEQIHEVAIDWDVKHSFSGDLISSSDDIITKKASLLGGDVAECISSYFRKLSEALNFEISMFVFKGDIMEFLMEGI